jgi:hypothetical protein
MDAVFGLVVLALAFLVQRIIQGRPVFAPVPQPAGDASVPRQPDRSQARTTTSETEPDDGVSTELVRPPVHTKTP